jgi:hypothetical protein
MGGEERTGNNKNQGQEDKSLRKRVEDRQHECRGVGGGLTCNSLALYGQSSPSPTSSSPFFNKS